jgi:plasmid maintenance system antidote protein VapI
MSKEWINMNTKAKKSDAVKFLEKVSGGPLTLGRWLEAIRLGEDATLREFAESLEISVSHLNDIEKGRKHVSPERALRFARLLGYSEEQFVELALQEIVNELDVDFKIKVSAVV